MRGDRTVEVIFFLFYLVHPSMLFIDEERHEVYDIRAAITETAQLPCKPKAFRSATANAEYKPIPNLVIWYKHGYQSPIYSFDRRKTVGSTADGSHWSNEKLLGHRGYYNSKEYTLTVERVIEMDSGLYKCRLDFDRNPTENYIVNFTVSIPPKLVIISDTAGSNITDMSWNPVFEGRSLNLICTAYGGKPIPRIIWKLNEEVIDDLMEDSWPHRQEVRNELFIERLQRNYQQSSLRCEASNDGKNILSAELTLQLLLKPLLVQIVGENEVLSAGREYKITCITFGSRPPANITWFVQGIRISPSLVDYVSTDKNETRSTLKFYPRPKDNGSKLTCKASNSFIHGSTIAHSWNLNVNYAPITRVQLGSNLNQSTIKEGVDVYFDCIINANPISRKLYWTHNGTTLNSSTGIIISNQTLVLQSVSKNSAGNYSCFAANSEGESASPPFYLDVKYEPFCSPNQQQLYGAIRHEKIHVTCNVNANPSVHKFRWQFNNSLIQMKELHTDSSSSGSRLHAITYQPKAELDYGTLLCWAENDVGVQSTPCVFHIIPAGKPEVPRNCSILNVTENSFSVACESGFDGGLPQEFICEISTNNTSRLVWNITNRDAAEFKGSGLEPDTLYRVIIYSNNAKGRSYNVVDLNARTLAHLSQRHTRAADGSKPFYSTIWMVLLCFALLILLCLLILVIVTTLKIKSQNRNKRFSNKDDLQRTELPTPLYSDDERNPDIIPHIEENSNRTIRRNSNTSYPTPLAFEKNEDLHYCNELYDRPQLPQEEVTIHPPFRNSVVHWTEHSYPRYSQQTSTVTIPQCSWQKVDFCSYHHQSQQQQHHKESEV